MDYYDLKTGCMWLSGSKNITCKMDEDLFFEKVVNFKYGYFENLTSKKCLKSGELSSPLSAYSYSSPGSARLG